ncbi:hypothetical protein S2M10_06830 [Sphingomonas sp. S2M10]|uniref:hypothetical protein n=1 Tax=Sphingomonas sp. S2M10 TaxID=2705010 RepID=UPI001456C7FD|nr:hypothetical protein [Sphingomonas sp. S2M10]NLS25713.1 hypothetical protein [Sphingomonas sp. S2M10]
MKLILLLAPAVIAGASRYPVEGPISVADDDYADRLIAEGKAEPAEIEADADAEDLDGMKVADLKQIAAAEEIDLGDATRKDEILTKIREARIARADRPQE